MKQKYNNWKVRLFEELKASSKAYFITLTIDNENYFNLQNKIDFKNVNKNGYRAQNMIMTKAIRLWLERIRKETKKSVKHWLISELGQNSSERIHAHGIIFDTNDIEMNMNKWKYGMTYIGEYVNERTINYMSKYMNKIDLKHKDYYPIILCSKGIGSNYLKSRNAKNNRYNGNLTNETYRTSTGHKLSLPY